MWKKAFVEKNEMVMATESSGQGRIERERANIGPSITFNGTLAGEEDVLIQGRIEGSIEFQGYSVTIGKYGRIKADIHAREVCVEGELEGNVFGQERVELSESARVKGNIEAPRVVMKDGALFKGSVDMSKRPAIKENPHKDALSKMPGSSAEVSGNSPNVSTVGKKSGS